MSTVTESTGQIPAEVLGLMGGGGPATHEEEEDGAFDQGHAGGGAVGVEGNSETREVKQEESQTLLSEETEGPVSFDRNEI